MKKIFKYNEFYIFLILVLISTVFTIINPTFIKFENLFDIIKSGSLTAILAIGVFVILLSGGFDLSFTAIAVSSQYISLKVMIATGIDNIFFAFLIAILIGILLGSINGLLISNFKLPPFLTTLGTLNIFHGILVVFVGKQYIPSGELPSSIANFGEYHILKITRPDGTIYGLSVFIIIVILIILITWFIVKYTMLGRGIQAVGSNVEAARREGFNVKNIQLFVYCYGGILYGIMGVMNAALLHYSDPVASIVGTELLTVSAVVLGGVAITGGSGSVWGTLLGTVILSILYTSLVLIGLSSDWNEFFIGFAILVSIALMANIKKINFSRKL